MSAEENFKSLHLELPPAPTPIGVYIPFLIDGKHVYVSGHGPLLPDKSMIRGRIGEDMDPEQGKLAARQVGLAILATLKHHLGSLDKIKRVIKAWHGECPYLIRKTPLLLSMVAANSLPRLWGKENGIGVRSAVGMATLPDNIPVEIEAMFELT